MRVSDIHMFVTVAERKSFTRAAEELYVAQPGISRKISEMERELGCALFERNTRSVKLTEVGEVFYRHAKNMDKEMQNARLEIRELIERPSGVLRIGYSPIDGQQRYLMNTLNAAIEKLPGIRIEVRRVYSGALAEQLQLGKLDCCLLPESCAVFQGLDYMPLYTFDCCVVLPRNHPLAKEKSLTISQLKHEPYICLPEWLAPKWYRVVGDAYRRAGEEPVIAIEAQDVEELLMYVQMGRGIAFMRGKPSASYDVASVPVRFGVTKGKMTIVWMPGKENENLVHFIKVLRDEIDKDALNDS